MALIECPECNSKISENATACPTCGNPMRATDSAPENPQKIQVESKEGCFLQTLNAGCMFILILGLVFFLALVFG